MRCVLRAEGLLSPGDDADVSGVLLGTSLGAAGDTSPVPGGDVRSFHARRREFRPMRLVVADPPYPEKSHLYRGHPDYAGEVDHIRLLERLETFDGWALSTSRRGVRDIFHLCPPSAELCVWVKPRGIPPTRGPSNVHEYVIVVPARRRFPGVRDALVAPHARGGDSDLIGRKPPAWCAWVFALLGAEPCDSLDDMFPGSGAVSRAWDEFRRSRTSATGEVAA